MIKLDAFIKKLTVLQDRMGGNVEVCADAGGTVTEILIHRGNV